MHLRLVSDRSEPVAAKMTNSLESCLHGKWVDGVCVCEIGYESLFDESSLNPVYCGERKTHILANSLTSAMMFHLLMMSVNYFSPL